MPVVLVGSDMISDGGVLVQMWQYTWMAKDLAGESAGDETATNSTGTTTNSSSTELAGDQEGNGTVVGSNSTEVEQGGQSRVLDDTLGMLFLVSILILFFSTVNLLFSNWLSTLLRNARTTLMMESRELERKDAPVPLGDNLIVWKLYKSLSPSDHLSRHDLSINESLGESAYQQVIQLIFYLTLLSLKVRTVGPNAQTDLEFWSLLPSFLLSTLSLSLGQNKVLFNHPINYNSFMNTKKNTLFQTLLLLLLLLHF